MLQHYVNSYVEGLKAALGEIDGAAFERAAALLLEARIRERQVFIIGNGGSAAAASHMACDLAKGTVDHRTPGFRRFRVISLTDNMALATAIGNDLSFDDIFVEQLRGLGNQGDLLFVISASGNSANLLRAIEWAKSAGVTTVGLLGFGGGQARGLVDLALVVSSRNYGIAEDFHLTAQHVLTQYLRRALAGPVQSVLFLDRDGVINVRPAAHEYVLAWDDFRFLDGALEALRGVASLGYRMLVITNQQGVGKGLMSSAQLSDIHDKMVQALGRGGVPIDGVFCCPHLETEDCACRKPRPGLIHQAITEVGYLVDTGRSYLLGDSASDVVAGAAAGLRTIYFASNGTPPTAVQPSYVVSRLADVVPLLAAAHTKA